MLPESIRTALRKRSEFEAAKVDVTNKELNRRLALRSGYNFNSDEFKFAAGAGLYAGLGQSQLAVDYAYTQGDFLGAVNRLSIGVRF